MTFRNPSPRLSDKATTIEMVSEYKRANAELEEGESQQFLRLIDTLENVKADVLVINIGSGVGDSKKQQLPTYILNMALTKNVHVLLINPLFNAKTHLRKTRIESFETNHAVVRMASKPEQFTYRLKNANLNLTIDIFSCAMPKKMPDFYLLLTESISNVLTRKGQVFIANHTQDWSLADIPQVADVYNSVKKNHPNASLLQLYTQGGNGRVRYYLDNLYDPQTSDAVTQFEPHRDEFYVCDKLEDLSSVPQFLALSRQSFIAELGAFITLRAAELKADKNEYHSFWGRIFSISASVKINAAEKMVMLLDYQPVDFEPEEMDALRNSRLGDLVSKYEKLIGLPEDFVRLENMRVLADLRMR